MTTRKGTASATREAAVTIGQDPAGPLAMVRETRPAMGADAGAVTGGGAR